MKAEDLDPHLQGRAGRGTNMRSLEQPKTAGLAQMEEISNEDVGVLLAGVSNPVQGKLERSART
ncbi:hypothetical protein GCM10008938_00010 [Deinococcus roseus]|uniref:Transposase n=1 Tax=Deinococcus roseus TaxID=392414 RepID=A0ABQ2CVD1_9DEIO|nr:hypothetical protein GCM10008938_00010 [Deinococcus roseus]